MKKNNVQIASANNSNTSNEVIVNVSSNLPEVEVQDATTTKGKVSTKFNLNDQATAEAKLEKIDKNQLFAVELADYFCPVKFDPSALEASLSPLVASGILPEDAKAKAIETAKRDFLAQHEAEINEAQNLTFAEVLAKLKEKETLYKKVLQTCNVSELNEADYIENGKVLIYRANQCKDKEGNDRYKDVTLSRTENGMKFCVSLFVEYRDITTNNILLAIRYHQSKQDANKRLLNQISDYKRILSQVYDIAKKAKENLFSFAQVVREVEKVFNED